jgi:pimeloyl-ACP methyl ester carboxylesterase
MHTRAFFGIITLCLASACATTSRTWELPPGVKAMHVNGYDLAYVERGQGTPLVFVHGANSDYRTWAAQMEPFAQRYHVYALSMRHYYPERWNGEGGNFSIQQHADDVIAFIERLGVGKVHLVVHSRGGNIGLHVGKKAPQLLKTLVLADPSGLEGLLPGGGPGEGDDGNAVRRQVAERFRAGDIDGGSKMYSEFTTGKGAWDALTEEQKQARRDNYGTVIGDTDRPRTACEEGKRFTMPVLFVNGENSPKRYPTMAKAFAACVPNATMATVPVASHGMFRTHPVDTNRIILDFLAKHP